MEAWPTRRPHLPQRRNRSNGRTHLRRMAEEAQTDAGCAEIWKTRQCWKSCTGVTGGRVKKGSRSTREASKGATGLLHFLTQPRAVLCPKDATQREATNPRDATELAAKGWARIWRVHVEELQTADRPWDAPDCEDTSELPQLTVDGSSGFNGGWLIQGQDGHRCRCDSSLNVVAHLGKG